MVRLPTFELQTTGNRELVLEDAPPKALEVFIQAMYGNSLKDTLLPLPVDPEYSSVQDERTHIHNVRQIISFGHKYNIRQIESAVCDIVTSRPKSSRTRLWMMLSICTTTFRWSQKPCKMHSFGKYPLFVVLQYIAEENCCGTLDSHIVVARGM